LIDLFSFFLTTLFRAYEDTLITAFLPAYENTLPRVSGFFGLIPTFVGVALFVPEQSSGVLNQTPE
jgi:hypothetical protein